MGGKSKTKDESTRALKTGLCQAFHISETESPIELGFTLTKIKNEPTALDHTQDQGCWREQPRGNQSGPYSPDSNTAKETTVWSTYIFCCESGSVLGSGDEQIRCGSCPDGTDL